MAEAEKVSGVRFVVLDKVAKKQKKPSRTKPENLIRRAGGLKKKDLKYADFEPLYQLWSEYFSSLMTNIRSKPDERLLKADFHGCILRVSHSQNPSQIGLHGIVIHESRFTFQMITKADKVIVIPKEGCTFQFVMAGKVFTLFGDALRQRPFLRGRKVRHRATLPFFLE
ncbi:ribonuclease P protein subunit p29 [Aphelenchoides avenae]|nr:ribonuclease P protein subunit p29 [Aphelenchus avenae]KAH7727774.1 ribonuclease P protein subunit p29 [Aphelenchus avenae]